MHRHEQFFRLNKNQKRRPTYRSVRLPGKPTKCDNLPCSCPCLERAPGTKQLDAAHVCSSNKHRKHTNGCCSCPFCKPAPEDHLLHVRLTLAAIGCTEGQITCAQKQETGVNPAQRSRDRLHHLMTHFRMPVKRYMTFGPCQGTSYTAITLNPESNFTRREKNHSPFQ